MSDRPSQAPSDKLVEPIARAMAAKLSEQQLGSHIPWHDAEFRQNALEVAGAAIAAIEAAGYAVVPLEPRPISDWHEDMGYQLWWRFPIAEPPYCGSPLCSDWPDYHTHFTPIPPVRPR